MRLLTNIIVSVQLLLLSLWMIKAEDYDYYNNSTASRRLRVRDNNGQVSMTGTERNRILLPEVTAIVGEIGTISSPLGLCQGDCDGDNTCTSGLKCMTRSANEAVPGCAEPVSILRYGIDVCYDPRSDPNYVNTLSPTISNKSPTKSPVTPPPTMKPTAARPQLSISNDNNDLDKCVGECDNDNNCRGNYVCYKRDYDGPVPGCVGSGFTGTNFCIDPADNESGFNNDGKFSIKMYWENGYNWQQESFERKWCIKCGGQVCDPNDELFITECGRQDVKFIFVNYRNDDSTQIKLSGTNFCLQVQKDNIRPFVIDNCDTNNAGQYFYSGIGNFIGNRFEIMSTYIPGCISINHHPKSGEVMKVQDCDLLRYDTTSFYNRY